RGAARARRAVRRRTVDRVRASGRAAAGPACALGAGWSGRPRRRSVAVEACTQGSRRRRVASSAPGQPKEVVMDLHLSGKPAVVTGASKGIGLAVTEALVEAGAHVVAGARTRGPGLDALEDTGQVSFVPVDLAKPGTADELVAAAAHRGGIDVLVNNVGAVT